MVRRWLMGVAFLAGLAPMFVMAADPWPGEAWQESTPLTYLDPDFQKNLSGAHWNHATRTLWVCINGPGRFWAIVPTPQGGLAVDTAGGQIGEFSVPGDIEGITQVEGDDASVYVLLEDLDRIRRYDVSSLGHPVLIGEFNILPYVPAYRDGAGSEGITFVPDSSLAARGFVDAHGQPCTSRYGLGGLMFVAHQRDGAVYVFDLDPVRNAVTFVGRYITSRGESSGLEFGGSSASLYIWHNTDGNYLERTDLTSQVGADGARRFMTVQEFRGPKGGNLEGIAIDSTDGWFFATDDDNQNGYALMWFRHFDPADIPGPEPETRTVEVLLTGGRNDVEQRADGSVSMNSTDLELVTDQTRQTVGLRFENLAVPAGAQIVDAYLQFTVDEATSEATELTIRAEASPHAFPFSTSIRNVSVRPATAASVRWSVPAWNTIDEAGPAQRSPSLLGVVQEVVDLPGFEPGNAMVFLVTGTGRRTARAWEVAPEKAPRLLIEYVGNEPAPGFQRTSIEVRLAGSGNDVEEQTDGILLASSTDLELVTDTGSQVVGLRFANVQIPAGAEIVRAHIQFTVDETSSGATTVILRGEATGNAAPFSTSRFDVSRRLMTLADVVWTIEPWSVVGEGSAAQRTPDLSAIVQEVVDTSGFRAGNAIVLVVTGSGRRTAESSDGLPAGAPLLLVEYRP